MTVRNIGLVLLAVALLLSVASSGRSDENVVERRTKIMKQNSKDSKAIKAAFAKGDYAVVEAKANHIVANLEKIAKLFPEGSTSDKSRAKPEIWKNWDEFKTKLGSAKTAARGLAEAAETKDEAKTGEKFVAFGKSCGACHKLFRAPRK